MSRRTRLKITDERERQLEKASEIVASGPDDDPPMSVVIDAAFAYVIQSEENIRQARGELDPTTIQRFNTDVTGLRYRTKIRSRWRSSHIRLTLIEENSHNEPETNPRRILIVYLPVP